MSRFQCGVAPWQFKCLRLSGACSQLHSDKADALGQFPETAPAIAEESFIASRGGSGDQAPEKGWLGAFLGARGQGSHPQPRRLLFMFIWQKRRFVWYQLY